ncbi:hypothetical protein TWF694_006738 [Orbilia ellipsospora]|uniref:Uncharacterized protein n=1 Tax=Orbilia ellipsospora TaxID=2528407 RepID=A0AAV9XMN5_9PEZI
MTMSLCYNINPLPLSKISHFLPTLHSPTIAILLFLRFVRHSNAVENGNLGITLAILVKTEVLVPKEWRALTENNGAISNSIRTIVDIASDFQDSIENIEVFQSGYLCGRLENVFVGAIELEDLVVGLMVSYDASEEEIDKIRQSAFDPLDQSIKAILNVQIEDLTWKPSASHFANNYLGVSLGGRTPVSPHDTTIPRFDNTLDTILINTPQNNIAQMSPYYSSRGNLGTDSPGNTNSRGRRRKERYNLCDLTDGLIYFFKNDLLDHEDIYNWIWEKRDLFSDEILINTVRPQQINKTFKTAFDRLMQARDDIRGYNEKLVRDIIFQKNFDPIMYPDRLPRVKAKTMAVETEAEKVYVTVRYWLIALAKLVDAVRAVQKIARRNSSLPRLKFSYISIANQHGICRAFLDYFIKPKRKY